MGGRSRVAAQMLAGQGFETVINMAGGIKAWKSQKAVGEEELGLDLFSGRESTEETLLVAYSLEEGLREFYLAMADRVQNENTRRLFVKLSTIETKHQERVFKQYLAISNISLSREDFEAQAVTPAMEGGLTTEEYLTLYPVDLEVVEDVISLAMSIEAQALDLYQRAVERAESTETKAALLQIADEERAHLKQLGKLFEAN